MRIWIALIAAAAITVPISVPAAGIDDLLAKHRGFSGWGGQPLSWHATGTRRYLTVTDKFTEAQRGVLYRDSITSGDISNQVGFNGRVSWSSDENNFVALQLGRAAQDDIAFDLIRSDNFLNAQPALSGEAVIAGTRCAIIRIQPAGLPQIDIYEDPATGAYARVVVAPGSHREKIFDDLHYTMTPKGAVLSSWHVDGASIELTAIDTSAPVSDGDLHPAPATASWSYDTAPVPLTVAAISDSAHLIRVPVSVNGHVGLFVLSTGTPSIILFDNFANEAGVETVGTSDFSPYSGNVTFAGYGRAHEIKIGGSVLHNALVAKMTAPASRAAGILGYDFFAGALVSVDLSRAELRIADPNGPQAVAGPNGYAFPIDLTSREPAIAMMLPGGGAAHPVMDTSLSGFFIASQALRDAGRISGHDVTSEAAVGFGGQGATGDPIATLGMNITYTDWHQTSTTGPCITTAELYVGPYKYENPAVCFAGSNVLGNDGGLLGFDFLRHFNWTIDYPHGHFILTPNGA